MWQSLTEYSVLSFVRCYSANLPKHVSRYPVVDPAFDWSQGQAQGIDVVVYFEACDKWVATVRTRVGVQVEPSFYHKWCQFVVRVNLLFSPWMLLWCMLYVIYDNVGCSHLLWLELAVIVSFGKKKTPNFDMGQIKISFISKLWS